MKSGTTRSLLYSLVLSIFCSHSTFPMEHAQSASASASASLEFMDVEGISSEEYEAIERVWATAPLAVRQWAKELQNQNGQCKSKPYRLFLYGEPGVGKTKMAEGIWLQNRSEWLKVTLSASNFINRYLGGTGQLLANRLEAITKKQQEERVKIIVIIEEAHILLQLMHTSENNHSSSSEPLRDFLDTHKRNPNMMVILTGNGVSDLTPSMNARLSSKTVKIKAPSRQQLRDIFYYYMRGCTYQHISSNEWDELFDRVGVSVGRDAEYFAHGIQDAMRDELDGAPISEFVLTKEWLNPVIERMEEVRADFNAKGGLDSHQRLQIRLHKESEANNERRYQQSREDARALEANNERRYQQSREDARTLQRANQRFHIAYGAAGLAIGCLIGHGTVKTIDNHESTACARSGEPVQSIPEQSSIQREESQTSQPAEAVASSPGSHDGHTGVVSAAATAAGSAVAGVAAASALQASAGTTTVATTATTVSSTLSSIGAGLWGVASAHPGVCVGLAAYLGLCYYLKEDTEQHGAHNEREAQ